MGNHTPGPWVAQKYKDDWYDVSQEAKPEHHEICMAAHTEADARLIAAAPELLEALQAFLRAPHIGSGGPGSSTIVVQDFNLRAARAAIAKAEGG